MDLFLGNLFLTLSWSLDYETIQPNLIEYTGSLFNQHGVTSELKDNYNLMNVYCKSHENFVLNQAGVKLEIPCATINKGPQEVIDYEINNFIYEIYYKNYDCGFWQ